MTELVAAAVVVAIGVVGFIVVSMFLPLVAIIGELSQ